MRNLIFALTLTLSGLLQAGPVGAQSSSSLKSEELDQLVAPIALYPDTLLSNILMASTYPLEVVEAERWAQQNKALKGDALKKAVDQKKWDDSVKSLTAVPDVLKMMSDKLDWTQKLGDTVLAQQADVMDAIQRLRQKAQVNDKLKTTKQQKVTTTTQNNRQYIAIEPTQPNTIYVPYYDPAVVYGTWPYPAYPPYYFGAPGYIAGGLLATGLAFGAGYALGSWTHGGGWWGGSFNWGNNNININNNIDINKRNNWVHNSDHRHGVRYNNDNVRQKYAKGDQRGDIRGKDQRMDFRGRDGQQVLKPGNDRPGDRPGADRPGDRPGGRPDARPDRDGPGKDARPGGDRKPGGDRPQARPGGDRAGGDRPGGGDRPKPQNRGPQQGGGFDGIDRGAIERAASNRGHASLGDRGGGRSNFGGGGGGRPQVGGGGGGGRQFGGGGGGGRVGGGGGGGRGGGGRR